MFKTKKAIIIIVFLVINLFQFSKILDEESGLPAYNELKVKIESVRAKIDDMDVRNRQLSSEIRVLKKMINMCNDLSSASFSMWLTMNSCT